MTRLDQALRLTADLETIDSREIRAWLGLSRSRAHGVLTEAARGGWLVPVGGAHSGKRGRPANVYVLSDAGARKVWDA